MFIILCYKRGYGHFLTFWKLGLNWLCFSGAQSGEIFRKMFLEKALRTLATF